jgi:hypothetical protein
MAAGCRILPTGLLALVLPAMRCLSEAVRRNVPTAFGARCFGGPPHEFSNGTHCVVLAQFVLEYAWRTPRF